MAGYNEILVGRYNRFLQKLLGMKGPPPARSLGGDILTVLPLFHGTETLLHQGWERFGCQAFQALGGAGGISKIQIRNPAGSNVIAVIEKIFVLDQTATDQVIVQMATQTAPADLANIVVSLLGFDGRGRLTPTCTVSSDALVSGGLGTAIARIGALVNQTFDLIVYENQEIPFTPGSLLQVKNSTAQHNLALTIFWRERFLEDSERT